MQKRSGVPAQGQRAAAGKDESAVEAHPPRGGTSTTPAAARRKSRPPPDRACGAGSRAAAPRAAARRLVRWCLRMGGWFARSVGLGVERVASATDQLLMPLPVPHPHPSRPRSSLPPLPPSPLHPPFTAYPPAHTVGVRRRARVVVGVGVKDAPRARVPQQAVLQHAADVRGGHIIDVDERAAAPLGRAAGRRAGGAAAPLPVLLLVVLLPLLEPPRGAAAVQPHRALGPQAPPARAARVGGDCSRQLALRAAATVGRPAVAPVLPASRRATAVASAASTAAAARPRQPECAGRVRLVLSSTSAAVPCCRRRRRRRRRLVRGQQPRPVGSALLDRD